MSTYATDSTLRRVTEIAAALSDPSRVRILHALRSGELCVCQLVDLLGSAPSTVSRHLSLLGRCRLVQSRRSSRWVYYRRVEAAEAPPSISTALEWIDRCFADSDEAARDRARLVEILACPVEERCR